MNVLDLHTQLVSFPSLSHEEGPIADFLFEYLVTHSAGPSRFKENVWFELGTGEDCLLLASHLDVVPPSIGHPYPPFEPTIKDGKIYGRGSVDAKGCDASMITALLELKREGYDPPEGKIVVACTSCEESPGPENGLDETRPHLPEIKAVLIGEPTELMPCISQKGLLILNLVAKGKSAHAARAHLGENAILNMASDIERIKHLNFSKEDPFIGSPTVTPTVLRGGEAKNVVPESCTLTLDIRSTPAYTHDELIDLLSDYFDSEVELVSKRLVPASTDESERIVQACLMADPSALPFGSPTMSDWLFTKDVPTVKIGPGRSELSHTAEEHIDVIELKRAVQHYKEIIKNYFELNK